MRDPGCLRRRRPNPVPPVSAGLGYASRRTHRPGADPRRHGDDRLVGHDLNPGLESAPSEIVYRQFRLHIDHETGPGQLLLQLGLL